MGQRGGALDLAVKALARRDLSEHGLRERLGRAGVDGAEAEEVVASLCRDGIVDDRRFAANRARALAERGRGDAAIRFELEGQRVASELIDEALASLEPERERAKRIVARRGVGAPTARFLAARGFDQEVIEAAVAPAPRAALG